MSRQNIENRAAEAVLTTQELREVSGGHKHKGKHKHKNKKKGSFQRHYAPMTCGGW